MADPASPQGLAQHSPENQAIAVLSDGGLTVSQLLQATGPLAEVKARSMACRVLVALTRLQEITGRRWHSQVAPCSVHASASSGFRLRPFIGTETALEAATRDPEGGSSRGSMALYRSHMAPELAASVLGGGGAHTTLSPGFVQDCFSLGMLLFNALTGEMPWSTGMWALAALHDGATVLRSWAERRLRAGGPRARARARAVRMDGGKRLPTVTELVG